MGSLKNYLESKVLLGIYILKFSIEMVFEGGIEFDKFFIYLFTNLRGFPLQVIYIQVILF